MDTQQIIVNDEDTANHNSSNNNTERNEEPVGITDGTIHTRLNPTLAGSSETMSNGNAQEEAVHQNEVTDNDCKNDEEEEFDGEDESDYEYAYEDEEDSHFAGFLQQPPADLVWNSNHGTTSRTVSGNDDGNEQNHHHRTDQNNNSIHLSASSVATSDETSQPSENDGVTDTSLSIVKKQWKEPSRAAVKMSLRAERETSGGKRRLAQDLYKIMMGDTTEQGFKLEPSCEDSMDKWKIVLFGFDEDSNLAKDLKLIGMDGVELEMSFPDQYPFSPPFVRVTRPKFKRQTGFVMNGALCMELLTSDGWNPINDIESVIVSIRSLLVVGDGRLEAADAVRASQAMSSKKRSATGSNNTDNAKKLKADYNEEGEDLKPTKPLSAAQIGSYTVSEARQAYSHLSDYHKKKGWDSNGWWAKKG